MSDRYDSNPTRRRGRPDIIEYIKDINERLQTSEVGLRIGHTSIEDGDLVVLNGDISVKESDGTTVLKLLHGSVPEIRMFPLGDNDTHEISWFGFDFGSAPEVDQAMQMQVERVSDLNQDGGKIILGRNYSVLSHWEFGQQETYLWLNIDPNSAPETIVFRGKMRNSWQYDTRQMFYAGKFDISAGFTTWTHTYASTWADEILPVVNVLLNGSTLQWVLDSFTVSGFTVRVSSTVSIKTVTFFNVRCN